MRALNYHFTSGRATEAPKLHMLSRSWATHTGQSQRQDWKWLANITERRNEPRGHAGSMNGVFSGQTYVDNYQQQYTTDVGEKRTKLKADAQTTWASAQCVKGRQSSEPICHRQYRVSPARRQPEELYCITDKPIDQLLGHTVARGSGFKIRVDGRCNSWLSPHRAWSNLMSQCDEWGDMEVWYWNNYPSVRKEAYGTLNGSCKQCKYDTTTPRREWC